MSDLITRLRKKRPYKGMYDDEAADRLETLQIALDDEWLKHAERIAHLESALKRLGDKQCFVEPENSTDLNWVEYHANETRSRIEYANEALVEK